MPPRSGTTGHDARDLEQAVLLLNRMDKPGEAFAICRQLYPRFKDRPDFLRIMMAAAYRSKDWGQAGRAAERLLKLRPDGTARGHDMLALLARDDNNLEDAVMHFERHLAAMPDDAGMLVELGKVLNTLNRPKEALARFARARELSPGELSPLVNGGIALRALGEMDDAAVWFRKSVELDPTYSHGYRLLAEMGRLDAEKHAPSLIKLSKEAGVPPQDKANAHFALFHMYERTGEYDLAFKHLKLGNDTMRRHVSYDVAKDEGEMKRIAEVFDGRLFERLSGKGSADGRMIFIIGMPRSGTTLVEQILSGHPGVAGGGELMFMRDVIRRACGGADGYPDAASDWKSADLKGMADAYLKAVRGLQGMAGRLTDKLPANFLRAGAIRLMFPNASIVHCVRDAMDTCFGNYRQIFHSGQRYSYDLGDTARYYLAYRKLMEHWRDILGANLFDVGLEALSTSPEPEARRLFGHCGLEFREEALKLASAKRPVYTASAAQVREGIHTEHIGRWRRYESQLRPLAEGLGVA